jgi:FtsP/CotA-like multicopper oxidase with cupredoxin domain
VEAAADPLVDRDRIFMIDDMKLDENLEFSRGNIFSRWAERHDGREGKVALVNGKELPLVSVAAEQTERWRFINASSARYFLLDMGGRSFQVIATDGGLMESPRKETSILITPGERVDILAGPFEEGEVFFISSLPYNRMTFVKSKHRHYAKVVVGPAVPSRSDIPGRLRTIKPLATTDARVNREIKLSVGPGLPHGIDFLVNGKVHANDQPVRAGELQVWEISNTSLMDHPFHLHGFFFQVLAVNGKNPGYLAWKDTVNVPPRSKLKIAWMPDDRPGLWMYHCHILEHHEAGMMANFEVVSAGKEARYPLHGHHHH